MAKRKCPECEEIISSEAAACPKCGFPFKDKMGNPLYKKCPNCGKLIKRERGRCPECNKYQPDYLLIGCLSIAAAIAGIMVVLAVVNSSNPTRSNNASKPSSSTESSKQWFQGGNLHNATIAEWKSATYENKLATAGDWLASTKWKGHLNSPDDFERAKATAQLLVNSVDKVVNGNEEINHWKVAETAAALITMSHDFDP